MTEKNKNMELWNSVCVTDVNETPVKDVPGKGYKCTTVDAQSLKKKATGIFGPKGIGWGIKDVTYETDGKQHTTYGKRNPKKMIGSAEISARGVFWFMWDGIRGEFDTSSSMVWEPGQDCHKKLMTNMASKAFAELGFNSDIYENTFQDDVYKFPDPASVAQVPPPVQAPYVPPPVAQAQPQAIPANGRKSILHVGSCEFKVSKNGNPQYVVNLNIIQGEFAGRKFKEYFQMIQWNGVGEEPFTHHKTRRFLTCVGFTNTKERQEVIQNPSAYAGGFAGRQFEADLKEEPHWQDASKLVLKVDGLEMSQASGQPPAQAPPAPQANVPYPPVDDVHLDADIDLEEDEDYLTG